MQARPRLPDLTGQILEALTDLADRVRTNHQGPFTNGVVTPQDRIRVTRQDARQNPEGTPGGKTRAGVTTTHEPVNLPGNTKLAERRHGKKPRPAARDPKPEAPTLQGHRHERQPRISDTGAPAIAETGLHPNTGRHPAKQKIGQQGLTRSRGAENIGEDHGISRCLRSTPDVEVRGTAAARPADRPVGRTLPSHQENLAHVVSAEKALAADASAAMLTTETAS